MKPMTEADKDLISRLYPASGTRELVGQLGRSAQNIRAHAHLLGVSRAPTKRNSKAFSWTTEKDGILRAHYPLIAKRAHPMTLKKLAAMVGATTQQARNRALALGLIVARTKEPHWSRDEEEFLADNCHKSVRWLKDQMAAKGWPKRTETAVASKRKRAQLAVNFSGNAYTANELARVMGTHSRTVVRWIAEGLLSATPRTDAADACHGGVGDRWEIEPEAVKRFIFAHPPPPHYRLATVDQDWFLSIVEPKHRPAHRQTACGVPD